jgi:toxin ParE1/3/4
MAFKIIWSQQARDDLRDIVTFIAENDPSVAESFGFRLMAKVDVLAQFPRIGRVVPEEQSENSVRLFCLHTGLFTGSWRNQVIAIARVWHGARGEPEIPGRLEY